jgi:hypothetical protein
VTFDVMWADDDCAGRLKLLAGFLEDRGAVIRIALDHTEAIRLIESAEPLRRYSLLVDLVLPYGSEIGGFMRFPGIDVARAAAMKGTESIVFLTVIARDSVAKDIEALCATFPNTRFGFVEKTRLLDANQIEDLVGLLQGEHGSHGSNP